MQNPRSLVSVQPQLGRLTYETFFGLTEKPFSLRADPRFLYHSPSHAATFENLLADIRRREGLLALTGEIGTGKTMLCRAVLRHLGRQTFSSFVPDPFASREDLLKTMLVDFGVTTAQDLTAGPLKQASRTELSCLLTEFLDSVASLEAFVVVIIDEAQNMSLPLIEEVRILADSFGSREQLQIVFVGQPELHAKMKLPELRQVDQRVFGYHRLDPLGRDAVAGYIDHRLHVAGLHRDRVLFPAEVIELLHTRSGGVPRLINRLCDRALHIAHHRQAAAVDREILEAALNGIGAATLAPTWDAIISAASAPSAPAVTASMPAKAEDFSKLVHDWVAQAKELALAHQPAEHQEFPTGPTERPAPPPAALRNTAENRALELELAWRDRHGKLRSETYLQRLRRVWQRRAAIAAVCFVAIYASQLSAVVLTGLLAGLVALPDLPALPAAPARAVLSIVPPPFPTNDEPLPAITEPAAVSDYVIAVGIFGDREHAERLVRELTQAGLAARQRPFQLRNQRVQQVVLGPFATYSDAVKQMSRLRQLGGYDDASVMATHSY